MTRRALLLLLVATLAACSSPAPDPAPGTPAAQPAVAVPAPPPAPVPEVEADAGPPAPTAPPIALGRPVLIDFSRADCLPCQLMKPWLAALRERHAGAVDVLEVSLDDPASRGLARHFRAKSVPLQVYVDAAGRERARNVGLATLPQMQRQLETLGFAKAD